MRTNDINQFKTEHGPDAQRAHLASTRRLDWTDPDLARITRLRLLGDRNYPRLDVSYCWGVTKDGQPCWVDLPFGDLPKATWKTALVRYAKRAGVYVTGLGIWEAVSIDTN